MFSIKLPYPTNFDILARLSDIHIHEIDGEMTPVEASLQIIGGAEGLNVAILDAGENVRNRFQLVMENGKLVCRVWSEEAWKKNEPGAMLVVYDGAPV